MTVIVTVAPTGPVAGKAHNPDLPTQPNEIADAVLSAYEAGAAVAHLHFRDEQDRPTADLGIAQATIEQIRERCPILLQVSTGVGLGVPFADRARLVELRPEMATLNPCSMSFGDGEFSNPPHEVRRLAARMLELGVRPELEVYDSGHLDATLRLQDEGLLGDHLQLSLVLGVRGGMAATVENLVTLASRIPSNAVWQVVAVGRANLALTAVGLAMGANARAGLEDTLHLHKGELSRGSTPLVKRTVALARALDRPIASVDQARTQLRLVAS